MNYLLAYLGIGLTVFVAALISHWIGEHRYYRQSEFQMVVRSILFPESHTTRQRVLLTWLVPAIAGTALVVAWPLALAMLVQHILAERAEEAEYLAARRVQREQLKERMSRDEVEAQEIVTDPLNAVPSLPFGHLHRRWAGICAELRNRDQIWSFENVPLSGGCSGTRSGYAIVRGRSVRDFIVTRIDMR